MPYVRKTFDTSRLHELADAARDAQNALEAEVVRLRRLGASWSDIGQALGVTRQSAWARFSAVTGEAKQ